MTTDQPSGDAAHDETTIDGTAAEAPGAPDVAADDANSASDDPTTADAENGPETGADEESDDLRIARREAANRRREVREREQTISERDQTIAEQAQTIGALQRQLVERLIESDTSLPYLHRPDDLFDVAGVDVADLTDDAGGIDPVRLTAALQHLNAERGYLFGDRPVPDVLAVLMGRQSFPTAGGTTDVGTAWAGALRDSGM